MSLFKEHVWYVMFVFV